MNAVTTAALTTLLPETSSTCPIEEALSHRDVGKLRNHYDEWAPYYDTDVKAEAYCGPSMIVDLLNAVAPQVDVHHDSRIIDACCGTGLVGRALQERGYRQLSGCDLSQVMVEQARATQAYQRLYGEIDLTLPLPSHLLQRFDAVLCCGAFIPGHLPASALRGLVAMTRPGGVVVVSIREVYYKTDHFEDLIQTLIRENGLSVLEKQKSARYLQSARAHYLAFKVQ